MEEVPRNLSNYRSIRAVSVIVGTPSHREKLDCDKEHKGCLHRSFLSYILYYKPNNIEKSKAGVLERKVSFVIG